MPLEWKADLGKPILVTITNLPANVYWTFKKHASNRSQSQYAGKRFK